MPVLPVDYPEPFAAVLGEGEVAQRRAFDELQLAWPAIAMPKTGRQSGAILSRG
jgi:hypothetical protein